MGSRSWCCRYVSASYLKRREPVQRATTNEYTFALLTKLYFDANIRWQWFTIIKIMVNLWAIRAANPREDSLTFISYKVGCHSQLQNLFHDSSWSISFPLALLHVNIMWHTNVNYHVLCLWPLLILKKISTFLEKIFILL